jgi:hypothetical protein
MPGRDRFQTLVDASTPAAEAASRGERAVEALARRGVILGTPKPEGGYAPGPRATSVTIRDASGGDRVFLGPPAPLHFQLMVGPGVHSSDPDRFEPAWAACPRCASRLAELQEDWDPAARAWLRGGGESLLGCPGCGRESPVEGWAYPPGYALGVLGLRFWNWPPLQPAFGEALSAELGVVLIRVDGARIG